MELQHNPDPVLPYAQTQARKWTCHTLTSRRIVGQPEPENEQFAQQQSPALPAAISEPAVAETEFDLMRQAYHKFLGVSICIAMLAFLVIWFWLGPKSHPRLAVTYIQTIDGHGHWRLRFGITNIGNCTVFTSRLGKIEVFNHTSLLSVGATSPQKKLARGEGQVIDAVLSEAQMDSIDGKWRYSCLYAGDGLRSRIYSWQWGPGGPGARANWLIPKELKGIPLTVKATSDWIEPKKP